VTLCTLAREATVASSASYDVCAHIERVGRGADAVGAGVTLGAGEANGAAVRRVGCQRCRGNTLGWGRVNKYETCRGYGGGFGGEGGN